nr:phage tail assembly chaperone [uncultured Mediterranean phage uvMED]|tara:strand:+ start:192 stop:545 length:354 start_codon:yes stop_codon:yes gene_type:complete
MPNKRTIDLITESYGDQMSARRKYEFKNARGEKVVDLYFKPLTRFDRQKAQSVAGTDEALTVSTQLLCQMAELEDGTKAFNIADAPNLQRELPENVLNEIELFLFDIKLDVDTAKND